MLVSVSPYDEQIRAGLDQALAELPQDYQKLIDTITDSICEAVQEKVRASTTDYLAESIKDDISRKAASVAESMLMNALAGNDAAIRNLFGFNDWYMRNLYLGDRPTQ